MKFLFHVPELHGSAERFHGRDGSLFPRKFLRTHATIKEALFRVKGFPNDGAP